MSILKISEKEWQVLEIAITDKIYSLNSIIDRIDIKKNKYWVDQVSILENIIDKLKNNKNG